MKKKSTDSILALSLTLLTFLTGKLFWFLPVFCVLPAIFTFVLAQPLPYLLASAIIAELFSTLPPGLAALIIFLPLVASRIFSQIVADFTLSYFFFVFLITGGQIILLYVPDIILLKHLSILPAANIIIAVLFSSVSIFFSTVLVKFNRTVQ